MVFYDSWETFERAAAEVYAGAAGKARYSVKYRNCDGALVLKVTDDCTCVQMRTERLGDLKKIAHIHRLLARSASNRPAAIKDLAPIFPASLVKKQKTLADDPAASRQKPLQTLKPSAVQTSATQIKKARGKKRN
ncbi:hypothetical protein GGI04_004545 [Coemansia thaxteri]|nr:hypothetical protein GGI04_004545 [Coemansia thaxteri]KAJ2325804.1 hypothetical protein GGH92_010374 [Coemansia sp. RSA 2673]KAJ2460506.1 hypothetical protein GGI02_005750 [Coemansia sp. RSA 2322]